MKQYGYIIALLIMALPLSLAGCAEAPSGNSALAEGPGISAQASSSEAPNAAEPDPEAGEQADHALSVSIRDGLEEDLEEGACWQYIANEDGVYLVISPDDTVHSFKFVAIHVEGAGSGLQYVIDEERYAVEELTPDKPFLVKLLPAGLMPNYGIVFEDQSGRERFYSINVKGTGREESYPYYLDEIGTDPEESFRFYSSETK